MAGRPVQLRVGGQTYRVVTTVSEQELQRLAGLVEEKLAAVVPPGRPMPPQALLLAAMALAHELQEERARSRAIVGRARMSFDRLLARVDRALDSRAADDPAPG